jgi:hypothetical protein
LSGWFSSLWFSLVSACPYEAQIRGSRGLPRKNAASDFTAGLAECQEDCEQAFRILFSQFGIASTSEHVSLPADRLISKASAISAVSQKDFL